ncbi:hypothetical protein K474DRAFT_1667071 [Panus rudis PR-1116 ss-1]|nr:hypothetical protein K474DRAFT_1667071 [Panus rudis PR-1116 ss-1]
MGFKTEWPMTTGRAPIPNAANIVWIVWVVLIPVVYFAGVALLRRQFRQERAPKPDPYTSLETSPRESMNPQRRY